MNFPIFTFVIIIAFISIIRSTPLHKRAIDSEANYGNLLTPKFNHLKHVDECIIVSLDETTYTFRSNGSAEVCGIYVLGDPEENVQITVEYLDFNCDAGGLVTILDGWHMDGQTFPTEEGEENQNFVEICDRVSKHEWTTSSNAATIMYKAPTFGDIFAIKISFTYNPEPCNVLLIPSPKMVTLRNFGRARNCSVATTFPAVIKMVQFSVGVSPVLGIIRPRASFDNDVRQQCQLNGFRDVVLIGGSNGLDTSSMKVERYFCGKRGPRFPTSHILCSVSAVTLISSGLYNNSVTVQLIPFGSPEIHPTTNCSSNI